MPKFPFGLLVPMKRNPEIFLLEAISRIKTNVFQPISKQAKLL